MTEQNCTKIGRLTRGKKKETFSKGRPEPLDKQLIHEKYRTVAKGRGQTMGKQEKGFVQNNPAKLILEVVGGCYWDRRTFVRGSISSKRGGEIVTKKSYRIQSGFTKRRVVRKGGRRSGWRSKDVP